MYYKLCLLWEKRFAFELEYESSSVLILFATLQNAGAFYDSWGAGLTSVKIKGFRNGTLDLSAHSWSYKVVLPFCFFVEVINVQPCLFTRSTSSFSLDWLRGGTFGYLQRRWLEQRELGVHL